MAQKRMLARNISLSRKVRRLSDRAALLFTWLIPYLDEAGLMEADPGVVRDMVVPGREGWSYEVVENSLDEMEEVGLITRYVAEDSVYLYFHNFEKFQRMRSDRPRKVEYPLPPPGILPEEIGDTSRATARNCAQLRANARLQPNLTKPKSEPNYQLNETAGMKPPPALGGGGDLLPQDLIAVAEKVGVSPDVYLELLESGVPEDFLRYALEETARRGKGERYLRGIIKRGRSEAFLAGEGKPEPWYAGMQWRNAGCDRCDGPGTVVKVQGEWLCRRCLTEAGGELEQDFRSRQGAM